MGAFNQAWLHWALLSAAFAALTALFAKIGVEGVDSDFATLIRTVIVAALLAVLLVATGRMRPLGLIGGRTWLFLSLSAIATGASWLCYFRALQIGDAARVAPVDKLSVVFVAVLAALFLGEKLSLLNWIGVGLIAAGAVLVAVRA